MNPEDRDQGFLSFLICMTSAPPCSRPRFTTTLCRVALCCVVLCGCGTASRLRLRLSSQATGLLLFLPFFPFSFLPPSINDKRQLIKGLVLREMYPSSRVWPTNHGPARRREGAMRGCRGSYVLISRVFLHRDADYRRISRKIAQCG